MTHFFRVCFFATLSFRPAAISSEVPNVEVFAHSTKWLNLLYYEKTSTHNYRSRVENRSFFVDQTNGQTSPLLELRAEIALFQQQLSSSDQHPQCLFPSRYLILKKTFALAPPVPCPKLDEWTKDYRPANLVLVYASQYLSNPASAMGHTFLLIPSQVHTRGFWLSYNYAASIPTDTSGFYYVWGGLTGGFTGDYSIMPLYQRLEQYGAIENRDLWFYTLKTTKEELNLFISHLWELVHNSTFQYYFKDENCAGMLLRSFAAIFPDLADKNKLDIQVPPIQVVKTLYQADRVQNIEFFPSKTNTMRKFLDQVGSKDQHDIYFGIDHPKDYASQQDQSPYVSEGILFYLTDQRHRNQGVLTAEQKSLERVAVHKRSQFKVPPLKIDTQDEMPLGPHLSHQPSRIGLGFLSQIGRSEFLDINARFTFHSLLDSDAGFLKNSGMELFSLRLAASTNSVRLKRFTIVQIQNFQPYLAFDRHVSWRIHSSVEESFLTPHTSTPYLRTNLAVGINRDFGPQYFYAFVTSDTQVGLRPESGFEIGPELGTILTLGRLKATASAAVQYGLIARTPGAHWRSAAQLQWNIRTNTYVQAQFRRETLSSMNLAGQEVSAGVGMHF